MSESFITEELKKLEHKKRKLEEMKEEVQRAKKTVRHDNTDQIKLNVGGTCFLTTKSTLEVGESSFLSSLVSGRYELKLQEDGAVFIDRDPSCFGYLLNYLRDGQLVFPDDKYTRQRLLLEAQFYGLESVVKKLGNKVHIFRSKLELPTINLVLDSMTTMKELLLRVEDEVASESNQKQYCRLRRLARRQNATKRPAEVIAPKFFNETMGRYQEIIRGAVATEFSFYLEQDSEPLSEAECETEIFVSVRMWVSDLGRPKSLLDYILPKEISVSELLELFAKGTQQRAEDLSIVEEVTETAFNVVRKGTLRSNSIITGDVLHIEPAVKPPNAAGVVPRSLVEEYYKEKAKEKSSNL
eukprot:TRINITY_DN12830_c0_g1_i1.p1 TRINITY_DN12830_c0_g1~~TRINITY_DN12830_c0_g1_i1.p1  ORF type:complete len:378 (+),score=62.43 TRINITY_DN12830_c0_g1_i1:72-1136(+)